MTLTVDVISDVICPWCYIGKRRLEAAIRRLGAGHALRREAGIKVLSRRAKQALIRGRRHRGRSAPGEPT